MGVAVGVAVSAGDAAAPKQPAGPQGRGGGRGGGGGGGRLRVGRRAGHLEGKSARFGIHH